MSLSMHALSVGTFVPTLRTTARLFEKAEELAAKKKFDPAVFVGARLAPDMFTLGQQISMACFYATNAVLLLTGAEAAPPGRTDDDASFADLRSRIGRAVDALEAVPPAAFAGADTREIKQPLFGDLVLEMLGALFLQRWSLPHFYFHVVTAYDILRHGGVEIGKRDFLDIGSFVRQR